MEAETLAFLKDIETRRGAPITWRTFCTWYGTSRHEGLERIWGVFLYRVGDTFYLEDFEHQNTFLGFPVRKRKTDKPYVRYEESFRRDEVRDTMQISKRKAEKIVQGHLDPRHVKPIRGLANLFAEHIEMVTLTDGSVLLFSLMDRKTFLAELEKQPHNYS